MIRLFTGFDPRESVGHAVFAHSVWSRASASVSITRLDPKLSSTDGTNAFTKSRFLVPYLCEYEGWALFMDGVDMLCLADVAKLWALRDRRYAVQVVKHDYKTSHPVKYLGETNLDYPRKNWSSVMLINCQHDSWKSINPVTIKNMTGAFLHRFTFLRDELIGELPRAWNYIVGELGQGGPACVAHFSIGLPVWSPYNTWDYAGAWFEERNDMQHYAA